jgi:hypothetical protein
MDTIKIRDTKQSTHNINEAFVADTIFDSIFHLRVFCISLLPITSEKNKGRNDFG